MGEKAGCMCEDNGKEAAEDGHGEETRQGVDRVTDCVATVH